MREFFGFGGYQRTPEGAYSWQHLLFVGITIALMIGLAILFGLRNRNKDDKTKNKVLIIAALLIDGFELFKIILFCVRDDPMAWKRTLPLFLCSIQLITIPLAAFSKGRIKESALDFVFVFGILGAIAGTIGAAQNYGCYPVLAFDNVVSAITHSISGFCSLYIVISGMESDLQSTAPSGYRCCTVHRSLLFSSLFLLFVSFVFRRKPGHPRTAEPSRKKKKVLDEIC